MKSLTLVAVLVTATATLAACGPKSESQNTAVGSSPPASNMAGMDMPVGAKMAKASGTVTAVDAVSGTITLDHGPIPEAGWPAMTMAFKASPAVTGQVKPGDKVDLDLRLEGGAGEVTAVRKIQP